MQSRHFRTKRAPAGPTITKMERNLARIAFNPSKKDKYDTFGVIVDASDPHKMPGKEHFVTKLKVIDPSFNVDAVIENAAIKIQNYAYIFIKNLNREDAPKVRNIGTVIRLRRFNFTINERGELFGIIAEFSNWLIIGAGDDAPVIEDKMERNSNEVRELGEFEAQQAQKLFYWARGFLERRSLRSVLWWSPLTEPNNVMHAAARHLAQGGVDLMLRVDRVEPEAKRIIFVDELGKKYFLTLETRPMIPLHCFVKLRSVDVRFAPEGRILSTRISSSCLILPDGCFDVKLFTPEFHRHNFHKIALTNARNRGDADTFEQRHKVLEQYPLLDDYYFEDFLLGRRDLVLRPSAHKIESHSATLIRKEFNNRVPTLLSRFGGITRAELPRLLHQKFVLLVSVAAVSSARDMPVVYHCTECGKTRASGDRKRSDCCELPLVPVIAAHLMVTDPSAARPLPLYAVTRGADRNPFALWRILPRSAKAGEAVKFAPHQIDELQGKLELLTREKERMKFVVEVKKTQKGAVFYEITDTFFLP